MGSTKRLEFLQKMTAAGSDDPMAWGLAQQGIEAARAKKYSHAHGELESALERLD